VPATPTQRGSSPPGGDRRSQPDSRQYIGDSGRARERRDRPNCGDSPVHLCAFPVHTCVSRRGADRHTGVIRTGRTVERPPRAGESPYGTVTHVCNGVPAGRRVNVHTEIGLRRGRIHGTWRITKILWDIFARIPSHVSTRRVRTAARPLYRLKRRYIYMICPTGDGCDSDIPACHGGTEAGSNHPRYRPRWSPWVTQPSRRLAVSGATPRPGLCSIRPHDRPGEHDARRSTPRR